MNDHADDAQRTFERKALANVRALLDKLEAEERDRTAGALKLVVVLLLVFAVAGVCVTIGVNYWPGSTAGVGGKVIVLPDPMRDGAAPRRKFIGERADEYRFAVYVDAWRQKIERVGNLNYPEEARRNKIYGRVQLNVGIRADGELESVQIINSSKSDVLDEAAIRIVRAAAPFEPFPDNIKADTDILHILRTWTFTNSEQQPPAPENKPIPYSRAFAPMPSYPEAARMQGIEGKVTAWLYVEADTTVSKVVVKQSPHELLSQEAIATFSKWRIYPPIKDGKPVPFVAEYDINFDLRNPWPTRETPK